VGDDHVLRQQHPDLHAGSGMTMIKWALIGAIIFIAVMIYLSYMVEVG
jgi:hypothetical protein